MAMIIVRTETVLGGKPRIRGTRISVGTIVSYFLNGYSYEDIHRDYPRLTKKEVESAKQYVLKNPGEFDLAGQKA